MKRLGFLAVGLIVLVAALPIAAQTPDGQTPANDGICDVLLGATPGLFGICVAFCEAHDCEPDFTSGNPFAHCKPSDPKLLEVYDRLKNPGDPDMPCIQSATGCPCFTQEQSDAIPTPYDQCIIDFDFGSGGVELTTNILHVQGTGVQAQISPFSSSCVYADGFADPPIFLFMETNQGQAEECRQIVINTIEANVDQCELLCDPVCN